MKLRHSRDRRIPFPLPAALLLVSLSLPVSAITWDNSNATGAWSTGANWDTNTEPTSADDVVLPSGLAGTITLSNGENAKSLQFDDAYTLSAGGLTLATASTINVANGITAAINTTLTLTGGSAKTGDGTLVLGSGNINATGIAINGGRLRITHASALGAAGASVNAGAFLEISGTISPNTPISLKNNGTVSGIGTPTSNGILAIDPLASAVTLATDASGDVLTLSTAANDLTGGGASTVVNIGGPGAIRLNTGSNFAGSWNIPTGRLELANATALGTGATSVTLSGGTLSARTTAAITFSGPGANLLLTADSSILSDRTTATAGVNNTFGSLSMGNHTLTVAPGQTVTSGTAAITLGDLTLTGNPVLAVNDSAAVNGKLTTGSLLGGGIARTITKTGAGDLSVTGGSTDLPAGSTFTATGGGIIELLFPDLGTDTTVNIAAAQNPLGQSTISITDGGLRLIANGASTTTPQQTFVLPSTVTLGGSVTLDPDRKSSGGGKIFELPGLTLATGTVLGMAGDNTFGIRLTGPLALQGNATLKGTDTAGKDGLLILDGGISGGVSTALTIGGGTSPINLTINTAGTYGGGTTMSGGNATLNAANALGTGSLSMSGGILTVNTDGALNGTLNLTGGTLRVTDTNALASNPISLNGGTLDFRNNTNATITTGALTVSGASGISIGGSGSGGIFDFPQLNVSGDSTLTVTPATTAFTPNFQNIALAGNLTLTNTNTSRIQTITEDGFPRTLIKAGVGTLELEGIGNHSGGTEVIAGTLLVKNAAALGSGSLTLGATSGTATATAAFSTSLVIPNNLVVRSGGSGVLTFDSPSGAVTWNGNLSLQKAVTFDNGSSTLVSTFNGVISGSGNITKISAGEIALTNAANTFSGAIALNDGTLSVTSDGALGNPANVTTLAGDAVLKIDGTFASSHTFAFTGTTNNLSVSGANEFTLNVPLAGAGTFIKSGTGIMTIAPGVDSSSTRSGAISSVTGGILRVQGVKNLSDTGIITLNGGGTIEFLRDADTTFPHPVTADGTGTLHVGRAIGGSGNNGRHTLGTLSMAAGNLTVTGANGYGLSFGPAILSSNSTITNNAPAALVLASLTGNPTTTRTLTLGGTGDIQIAGATSEGETGSYAITKTGPGTLRFGTSLVEFGRITTVQDGTLDLNGLSHAVNALTMGGAASVTGARLVTGAGGSLQLGGTLTFNSAALQAGAIITGNLDLGAASRSFSIANNSVVAADLTIDGPISGSAGAAIAKSGSGTLRLTGAGNTQPGLVSVTAGTLELAKSSGDAIGSGGLSIINNGSVVRLAANEQILNSTAVAMGNSGFFELNNFTETTGPVTFTQTSPNQYGAIKTGPTGTLVLGGDLTFNNNSDNNVTTSERNILITSTGDKFVPASGGTLDLGGATRTIHVATTTVGANETKANATIETRIINGGILKTGPRTLFLTNPDNTFNGGLTIAQGFIRPGSGTSLGLGPVTFTNAPGVAAGIDFADITGTLANQIATGNGGVASFTYSAPAPNTLVLSGGFDIAGELLLNVVNGTVIKDNSAVLDVTGAIDDAAGTFGLRKTGNGTLKLATGNTFGGGTVIEKGILAIAADSALGNTAAPLTINGGCLASSASFVLNRNVTIGTNGGNLRSNEINQTLEIAGALEWSSSTTSVDGIGRTVISGSTSGPGGDLVIGSPVAFATGTTNQNSWNSRVCLQGAAALPAGNLSIVNNAVLELGNGDFTRSLGTGFGEVQLPTSYGAGWAAVGADRSVNIGGAGSLLLWGQPSPAFLHHPSFGVGSLILGSISATHTVDFQNPLDFDNAVSSVSRRITTNDGAAVVDARLSGDLGLATSLNNVDFDIVSNGTLEITGDILGPVYLTLSGTGKTVLSGDNDLPGQIVVLQGTLEFANDSSFGAPNYIHVSAGAILDASAITVPVAISPGGFYNQIDVDGVLDGSVLVKGSLVGAGQITGNVTVDPFSTVSPSQGGTLRIDGDLTMSPGANFNFDIQGTVPEQEYTRIKVTGGVTIDGPPPFNPFNVILPPGFTGTLPLILNDGDDAINGIFVNHPEGTIIPLFDFENRSLQITYLANGDGGSVGNDFAVIVVGMGSTSNLSVTASGPIAVDLGAGFTINYNIGSTGPALAADRILTVTKPAGVGFALPHPANSTISGNTMTIALPAAAVPDSIPLAVNFTAPAVTSAASIVALVSSATTTDPVPANNSSTTTIAVLAGGVPAIDVFNVNTTTDKLTLGIDTINDITYVFQRSLNLNQWSNVIPPFTGNGFPVQFELDMNQTREFFRFGITPAAPVGNGN
jgi:autotransporter-associated beta strand protein